MFKRFSILAVSTLISVLVLSSTASAYHDHHYSSKKKISKHCSHNNHYYGNAKAYKYGYAYPHKTGAYIHPNDYDDYSYVPYVYSNAYHKVKKKYSIPRYTPYWYNDDYYFYSY